MLSSVVDLVDDESTEPIKLKPSVHVEKSKDPAGVKENLPVYHVIFTSPAKDATVELKMLGTTRRLIIGRYPRLRKGSKVQRLPPISQYSDSFPLFDPEVSSRHAELTIKDSCNVYVRDLKSRNGTELNGERLKATDKPKMLKIGDQLRFGNTWIIFEKSFRVPKHLPTASISSPLSDLTNREFSDVSQQSASHLIPDAEQDQVNIQASKIPRQAPIPSPSEENQQSSFHNKEIPASNISDGKKNTGSPPTKGAPGQHSSECAVCGLKLDTLSTNGRESHVNICLQAHDSGEWMFEEDISPPKRRKVKNSKRSTSKHTGHVKSQRDNVFCAICSKDMSLLDQSRRNEHVNRCCDSKARNIQSSSSSHSKPNVFEKLGKKKPKSDKGQDSAYRRYQFRNLKEIEDFFVERVLNHDERDFAATDEGRAAVARAIGPKWRQNLGAVGEAKGRIEMIDRAISRLRKERAMLCQRIQSSEERESCRQKLTTSEDSPRVHAAASTRSLFGESPTNTTKEVNPDQTSAKRALPYTPSIATAPMWYAAGRSPKFVRKLMAKREDSSFGCNDSIPLSCLSTPEGVLHHTPEAMEKVFPGWGGNMEFLFGQSIDALELAMTNVEVQLGASEDELHKHCCSFFSRVLSALVKKYEHQEGNIESSLDNGPSQHSSVEEVEEATCTADNSTSSSETHAESTSTNGIVTSSNEENVIDLESDQLGSQVCKDSQMPPKVVEKATLGTPQSHLSGAVVALDSGLRKCLSTPAGQGLSEETALRTLPQLPMNDGVSERVSPEDEVGTETIATTTGEQEVPVKVGSCDVQPQEHQVADLTQDEGKWKATDLQDIPSPMSSSDESYTRARKPETFDLSPECGFDETVSAVGLPLTKVSATTSSSNAKATTDGRNSSPDSKELIDLLEDDNGDDIDDEGEKTEAEDVDEILQSGSENHDTEERNGDGDDGSGSIHDDQSDEDDESGDDVDSGSINETEVLKFIRENKELYEQVLLHQVVHVRKVHLQLKTAGKKISLKALKDILDKNGVVMKHIENARKRKR